MYIHRPNVCARHTDDGGEYEDSDQVADDGENVPKRKKKIFKNSY